MKRSINLLTAGIVFCLLSSPHLTHASDVLELRNVQEQIKENQRELSAYQKKTQKLRAQLQNDDKQVARLARELWRLNQKRKDYQKDLAKLSDELTALSAEFEQQKHTLAHQLRQLAILGHQPPLVSAQNSVEQMKLMTYYAYLNDARLDALQKITTLKARIVQQQKARTHAQHRLDKIKQEKQSQHKALITAQKQRMRTLEKNKQLIAKYQHYLNDLQQAQAHLQNIPKQNVQLTGLKSLVGKLTWPVQGRLLAQFNQQKGSALRWKGLLIAAQAGVPVHAVAEGVVLFADWLDSYGMVMIIDHGHDYLTLYGHNQTLLFSEGDSVMQGDTIALLGQSGFQQEAALYFEIRHRGQALDPKVWLTRLG